MVAVCLGALAMEEGSMAAGRVVLAVLEAAEGPLVGETGMVGTVELRRSHHQAIECQLRPSRL